MLKILYSFIVLSLISCQSQTEKWNEWMKINSNEIYLSDSDNYEDLKFLNELLKDKRIVFLGESAHGVAEYTILKSRIIRYLHDAMNFDVLAFEVNAADAFAADYFGTYTNVDSTIYNSISTMWQVEEIVPLFKYINDTHSTENPLIIQGVDITQSNGSYAFSKFLYKLINQVDPIYAEEFQYKDSIFSAIGVRRWTIGEILDDYENEIFRNMKVDRLKDYADLKAFIETNINQFQAIQDRYLKAALFYIQSRINFIHWHNRDSSYMAEVTKDVDRYNGISTQKLFSVYRDYQMAQNLRFLTEVLFPDKKIIVWAQNAHIKKYPKRMSYELQDLAATYSISLFCYSGKGDWTFGQGFEGKHPDSMVYEFITPEDPLSIGQILHASGHEITFIDMRNQIENEGNSWMFNIAKSHDWDGSDLSEEENVRGIWDAIILINSTTTPRYLEYEYDYLGQIADYN